MSHLSKINIYCGQIQVDSVSNSAICKGESTDGAFDVQVEVYFGEKPQDIYLILASVFQYSDYPSDELSSDILGYVASIPYKNAEPNRAIEWVQENLSMLTLDTTYEPVESFADVRFHMSCHSKNIRCIALGNSKEEYDCNLATSPIDTPIPSKNPEPSPEVSITLPITTILTTTASISPTNIATLASTIEQISIFDPLEFTGKGNAVFYIDKWEGPALIHIVYEPNREYEMFSVMGGGPSFFVASDERYDGVRLIDILPGLQTESIEVSAESEWFIEIFPLSAEHITNRLITNPQTFQGIGDDVIFISPGENYQAIIKGNSRSTNFFVMAFQDDIGPYTGTDLLVNTIDPYEGTIDIPNETTALQIEAVGPWSIEFVIR